MDNPNRRRNPAALLALMAIAAGGGIGFGGGSGRPDFAPGPSHPDWERREPAPPEPPKRQHQPVFTAKQKLTRAKRKAQRKARKR